MSMKKWVSLALSALMVCSLASCGNNSTPSNSGSNNTPATNTGSSAQGGSSAADDRLAPETYITGNYTKLPADGPTVNLSLAHAGAENSDAQTVCLALKNALEKYSDGKISLTIYPNGQMGSDAEMISSCLAGDIDIVVQSGSMHVSFVPETSIFDTPFLTAGYDVDKIEEVMLNSEFRDMYDTCNEQGGFKLLMLKVVDTMNLTSNKAVNSLADLKGLKIRCAQSESRMSFWSSLGANPTPLAFSELYMALQNGTVEAQDNVWANAVTSGAGEVQKYMIPTQHLRPSMDCTMNKTKFDSLPTEYQAFITEVCDDVNRFDYALSIYKEQGYYEQLQSEYNLEVCNVSEDFLNEMKTAAQESIQSVHTSVNNETLYETLEKCLNQ